MILTAHQPVYLPWLGLFHKISLADEFVSYDQVQYVPYEWQNRNRVKTPSGPVWLTVPVMRKEHFGRRIVDIEIDNSRPWPRKHWRTIEMAYGRAPHFARYADFLDETYNRRTWLTLAELNDHLLRWSLATLGIDIPIVSAGEFDFKGTKSDRILDMCQVLGSDVFIFGGEGDKYADVPSFERAGVRPVFQTYNHPVYPQLHGTFVSHLSVIDLLANCGDDSLDILLSGNITRADVEGGVA